MHCDALPVLGINSGTSCKLLELAMYYSGTSKIICTKLIKTKMFFYIKDLVIKLLVSVILSMFRKGNYLAITKWPSSIPKYLHFFIVGRVCDVKNFHC